MATKRAPKRAAKRRKTRTPKRAANGRFKRG